MGSSKEELVRRIEEARQMLNHSIETRSPYEKIYQESVALDCLIARYVESGF